MNDADVIALKRQAEAEINSNEPAMLIDPLLVVGVIERLERAERKLAAQSSYDELHD